MNFREHTPLSGGQVDDTPFGGGAGMVLRVDVMDSALRAHYGVDPVELREQRRVIALTPGGRMLDDSLVDELAAEPALTLLCGRYEGFDERIIEHFASEEISIGQLCPLRRRAGCDGRMRRGPAQAARRARARATQRCEESFSPALGGDPEYPHYTRPAEYRGWRVPEVLLSGHHERIGDWRRERSRERGERRAAMLSGEPVLCRRAPERVRRRGPGVRYHCSPRRPDALLGVTSSGHQGAHLLYVMSSVIETIERAQLRRVPDFAPGDRVKVHFQVIEGTRRRVQIFEGVVIKRQGHGARETFTVRKQSFGVGVERMFPVHSPKIERIELAARGDVRRAKLYYLRDRVGKRARVRERRYTGPEEAIEPGLLHEAGRARPTRMA